MDHERHVGFVDPHAEGVCRRHDLQAVAEKVVLRRDARVLLQPRVVHARGIAVFPQQPADRLDLFARGAVDDPGAAAALCKEAQQRFVFVLGLFDREEEIRAVKAGRDARGTAQTETLFDVLLHAFGRRRGVGADDRALRQRGDERGDAQIIRTEVLSPLRDAVRLVHRDEADRKPGAELLEPRRGETLR